MGRSPAECQTPSPMVERTFKSGLLEECKVGSDEEVRQQVAFELARQRQAIDRLLGALSDALEEDAPRRVEPVARALS